MKKRRTQERWFVMLVDGHRLGPVPMVDEDEKPMLFYSEDEARRVAQQNPLGGHFGYEVFPWAR